MMPDYHTWVRNTWYNVDLGDKRRNHRVIRMCTRLLEKPNAGLPTAMESWSDLKAAYRLLNATDVSHENLQRIHWQNVREAAENVSGTVLYIQDGSELDYSGHESQEDLGPIGNHTRQGIMMHSCLCVEYRAGNPRVLGLAFQKPWIRENISKNRQETKYQRSKRVTEAGVWADTIKAIGTPPTNRTSHWVAVGDRANDIFSYLATCKKLGWECLLRVCQNRKVESNNHKIDLLSWVRSLPTQATKTLLLRSRNGKPEREITLQVSWAKAQLLPPFSCKAIGSLEGWYLRCWNAEEDIEWILYSSLPIDDQQGALEKIDWYASRWIIEEYHKCLKTGCRIEKRQLRTASGLLALLGLLGVIATKLLELRTISRDAGEQEADTAIPATLIKIVRARWNLTAPLTIREFWRRSAMLGGFIGRRSDGDPGWQTLWAGWLRLLDMWWSAEAVKCG